MTRAVSTPTAGERRNSRYRWADEFVAYVGQLCENSKARADLRSGLGRPMVQCARLDRYLAHRLTQTMSPDAQRARYAVAALIAAQPTPQHAGQRDGPDQAERVESWWQRPNLGASLARAVDGEVLKPGSAEDDLQLMTRQSAEGFHLRLPALTRRLLAAGVPVDWAVLLVDLGRWNQSRDQVVTAWQEQYYRVRARSLAEEGSGAPAERGPDAFVDHVLGLCKDKALRADLRTGLARPVERCHRLHPLLVGHLPEKMREEDRRAHYAVAALIAARPRSSRDADELDASAVPATEHSNSTSASQWWRRPNLGAALAQAVNKKVFKPESAEDDLHLMTRQSAEAVRHHLPALTRRLQSTGVPVDWGVLIEDLARWDRARDTVATRWLDSYFHVRTLEDRMNTKEEN